MKTEKSTAKNWIPYVAGVLIAALAIFLLNRLSNSTSLNYYITLLIVAFGAALALFTIQKSFASFENTSQYGTLKLGGPVVVFFMVIVGGYVLPQNNFDLTINMYDANSGAITSGAIVLNLDDKKEERLLDINGQATFKKLLSQYRNTKASIEPKIKNYPNKAIEVVIPANENVLNITIEKNNDSTAIHGMVIGRDNKLQKNAQLSFLGGKVKTQSDDAGNYTAVLPIADGQEAGIIIIINDSIVYNERFNVSTTGETNFYLK
ncbi:MAG: hypothetical protein JNK61_00365 [Bacteroidia bacterium]|nr:hypothetical protein [Bacteroidia bacterium]HQV01073.1 hypothetical protein [Bacteroidia bacterium]